MRIKIFNEYERSGVVEPLLMVGDLDYTDMAMVLLKQTKNYFDIEYIEEKEFIAKHYVNLHGILYLYFTNWDHRKRFSFRTILAVFSR